MRLLSRILVSFRVLVLLCEWNLNAERNSSICLGGQFFARLRNRSTSNEKLKVRSKPPASKNAFREINIDG
jgi:hypothetical protein